MENGFVFNKQARKSVGFVLWRRNIGLGGGWEWMGMVREWLRE